MPKVRLRERVGGVGKGHSVAWGPWALDGPACLQLSLDHLVLGVFGLTLLQEGPLRPVAKEKRDRSRSPATWLNGTMLRHETVNGSET